ncbi:MAG: DUF2291 domain-containing protein [Cytophagales bacterium]|nr:DUF2291 domain-containing protein [Cytophagales bacterium]
MKNIVLIILIAILAYNSVYFEKLSELADSGTSEFNFGAYADSLYNQGILKNDEAVNLEVLLNELKTDKDLAFKNYGNRLGIGSSAFFMTKIEGEVIAKTELGLKVRTPSKQVVEVDTKFIFGNAIRDASQLVQLTDFKTNAEFNALSEALNQIIREKEIPVQLEKINQGDHVSVTGALKLSKNQELPIQLLPVKLKRQ